MLHASDVSRRLSSDFLDAMPLLPRIDRRRNDDDDRDNRENDDDDCDVGE